MNDRFSDYDYTNSYLAESGVNVFDVQITQRKRSVGNFITPTPYSLTRTKVTGAVGGRTKVDMYYYRDFSGPGWYYGGQYTGFWEQPFSIPGEEPSQELQDLNAALKPRVALALLNQVGKELPDFDLITDVAEVGKTYSFLRDTVERLYRFATAVYFKKPLAALYALGIYSPSKKDLRWTKKRLLRWARNNGSVSAACSDIWMKYRYAVMPVLYSGNDALFALAGFRNDVVPTRSQVTLKDRRYVSDAPDTWQTFPGGGFQGKFKHIIVFETSIRAYGYWVGLKDVVSSVRGTRLLDFIQTGWELVPFSWIVDHFWNLSAYLNAQRVDSRLQWGGGAYTYKMGMTQSFSAEFRLQPDTSTRRYSGGFDGKGYTSLKSRSFYFKRVPWDGSTPSSDLEFPDLEWEFSWRRGLDYLALAHTALRGRLKQHMTL